MAKRIGDLDETVSAGELAEMGYCEKRVQLAHLHGSRTTAAQRLVRERGLATHQRYLEEGVASASDRRCFVSTCMLESTVRYLGIEVDDAVEISEQTEI